MVLITSMPAALDTTTKTAVVAIAISILLFAVYVCIIAVREIAVYRICQLQLRFSVDFFDYFEVCIRIQCFEFVCFHISIEFLGIKKHLLENGIVLVDGCKC